MTFIVQGEILVDGSDAQSEVKKLRAEQDKLKGSAEQVSQSTSRWSRTTEAARARLASLRSSASSWVASLRQVEQGQELAAGSAANLTAQFNDIGVMLAAGQNPLQLAIQQGTQITQAFGNRGAASAIAATRAAFINMISPLNLVTIGSIAAGAALVQWMTSASEEVEDLTDVLDRVESQLRTFKELSELSADEISKRWGNATADVRQLQQELKALALDQLLLDAASAGEKLTETMGTREIRRLFDGSRQFARTGSDALFKDIQNALESIGDAGTVDQQIKAVQLLQETLKEAAGGLGNLEGEQAKFYQSTLDVLSKLYEVQAASEAIPQAIRDQADEAAKAYIARQKETAEAEKMLSQLQAEAEISAAIVSHGESSLTVAKLRLEAERTVFQQRVDELNVSEALKTAMMEAWDAAKGFSDVDLASGVNGAAEAARQLADRLGISLGIAQQLVATGYGSGASENTVTGFEANDPRNPANNRPGVWTGGYSTRTDWGRETKTRSKPGSSSSLDAERKAIEELLRREQERLEILRETDPVQQEMIRHRETMASATDKEREALEAIIRKRVEEQNAIEAAQGAAELLGDVSGDVLTALTARGDEATDAWRRVKAAIAAAVLEAALLGEGSLAGLFGTSESGGLFGKIFKKADGGIITGKGGDRADQEIVLASPGEFFVNAKATRKHRHLLEAINAGALLPGMVPSFANGGAFAAPPVVSGGFAASGVSGERGASRVLIEPSPLFRAVVKEQAQDTALEVVQGHDRENSNATFDRNLNDPWSIG